MDIRFDEANDNEMASLSTPKSRSRSLTYHREIPNIDNDDIRIRNETNQPAFRRNIAETIDSELDAHSFDSDPNDFDSSFKSESAKGCGKLSNCVII